MPVIFTPGRFNVSSERGKAGFFELRLELGSPPTIDTIDNGCLYYFSHGIDHAMT
jgi:hypothetical protein